MTNEEFRKYVYSQYQCGIGGGFKSPDRCYEIINDRQKDFHNSRGYSQYDHYYKIRW